MGRKAEPPANDNADDQVLAELAKVSERLQHFEQRLEELPLMREQLQGLVRYLRDNRRRARQRVHAIRNRESADDLIAKHKLSDLELARARKLLMRSTRKR